MESSSLEAGIVEYLLHNGNGRGTTEDIRKGASFLPRPRQEVVKALEQLKQRGVLRYEPKTKLWCLPITGPKRDDHPKMVAVTLKK